MYSYNGTLYVDLDPEHQENDQQVPVDYESSDEMLEIPNEENGEMSQDSNDLSNTSQNNENVQANLNQPEQAWVITFSEQAKLDRTTTYLNTFQRNATFHKFN